MDPAGKENPRRHALRSNVFQSFFLDCCQDQVARITMRPADYRIYARLVRKFRNRQMSYEAFRRRMGLLLENPNHRHLRVWWNVYHGEVTGAVQMVDNPLYRFPLFILVVNLLVSVVNLLVSFLVFFAPIQNALMLRAAQRVLEQSRNRDSKHRHILGPEDITDEEDSSSIFSSSSSDMDTESD